MSATTPKQSHNTKANMERWKPYAKSGELARTAIEAAGLHRAGRMNAAQYAQRIQGIEREASEAGIEKEYREALRIQLEQLNAPPKEPEPPPAATPAPSTYEQLETAYRRASEEYLSAIREKDAERALHAESDLHELAFALERQRFGWSR